MSAVRSVFKCNDVVTRTIVTGSLVAKSRSQSHAFPIPRSPITRPHLPRHQNITPLDIPPRYLASRKQPNEVSPVWLFAKGTRSPVWRLDQRDRPPGKGLLGSAPVEVTVVACLGREGATSTRKSPAYSKPPSVEARCLACWTQQVGIAGGKRHSCSCLSLVVGTDVAEMHEGFTSDESDMCACNSVGK